MTKKENIRDKTKWLKETTNVKELRIMSMVKRFYKHKENHKNHLDRKKLKKIQNKMIESCSRQANSTNAPTETQ